MFIGKHTTNDDQIGLENFKCCLCGKSRDLLLLLLLNKLLSFMLFKLLFSCYFRARLIH